MWGERGPLCCMVKQVPTMETWSQVLWGSSRRQVSGLSWEQAGWGP